MIYDKTCGQMRTKSGFLCSTRKKQAVKPAFFVWSMPGTARRFPLKILLEGGVDAGAAKVIGYDGTVRTKEDDVRYGRNTESIRKLL